MNQRVAAFVLFGLVLLLGVLGCSTRSDVEVPVETPSTHLTAGSRATTGDDSTVQQSTPSLEELLAASGWHSCN